MFRAIILLSDGRRAEAVYDWRSQYWSINLGLANVPVPPGQSAMGALRAVHPDAKPVYDFKGA